MTHHITMAPITNILSSAGEINPIKTRKLNGPLSRTGGWFHIQMYPHALNYSDPHEPSVQQVPSSVSSDPRRRLSGLLRPRDVTGERDVSHPHLRHDELSAE